MTRSDSHLKIGKYLRENIPRILTVWETRVRDSIENSQKESSPTLIDHLPDVLKSLAETLEKEIFHDSTHNKIRTLGSDHGKQRAYKTDFSLEEIVKEYAILRQILIEEFFSADLMEKQNSQILHQFLDDAVQYAVGEFVKHSRSTLDTERKNIKHLFLNSKSFIGIFKGPDHVYDYLNPTHIEILGSDVTGKTLKEVVPDVYSSGLIKKFNNVLLTGASEVINEIELKVGNETRFFDAIYVPWRNQDGVIEGVMTLGNDVTNQVNSRREIEETVTKLKTERKLRENFVAALTHDLRTPLTAAKISAQIIIRKTDQEPMQKLASRIVDNLDRADDMIRDLLDAGRIKAGEKLPLVIKQCDINEVLKNTLDDLSTIHGNRFDYNSPGSITGKWDCSIVRRIIENLTNNAVKYGSGTTPITVTLSKPDGYVEIAVHNEGNPISADEQKEIFQPYQRLESAEKSTQKGWGIGLTLVRGFTEALGGKAMVTSSEEKGTTFLIQLPIK